MRRRLAIAIAVGALALPLTAHPDELRDGLMRGYNLLMDDDVQAALEQYERLKEAYPASPDVNYNLGYSAFRVGAEILKPEKDRELSPQMVEEAANVFGRAQVAFGEVFSDDLVVQLNAAFNRITAGLPMLGLAANAYLDAPPEQHAALAQAYVDTVKALQAVIGEYEEFLQRYPGHEGAEQNLAYARYLLKRLLQNPPPEPPEQEQQKGEDGEDEQQKEEGEQQQENQEGNQEQEEQDQDQKEQNQEQEPQEQPGDEEKEQEQQPQPEQGDQQQQPQEGEEQEARPNELNDENRQTIEAILDSIEEQDRREQEVLRKGTGGQIRGDWW